MDHYPIISILIVLPIAGTVPLLLLPSHREGMIRAAALAAAAAEFLISLGLLVWFEPESAGMQFIQKSALIPALGIGYAVGLDGISLWLVILTTLLTALAVAGCRESGAQPVRARLAGVLVFEAAAIGVFTALDAMLFCAFWQAALLAIYFMIRTGDRERDRASAAMGYVLYTAAGVAAMVAAMLYLHSWCYRISGISSFDILSWYRLSLPASVQVPAFLALAFAFGLQLPLIPFHGWLCGVHSKAPALVSVMVAAVLVNSGGYGFLRFCLPLLPEASLQFVPLIALMGVAGLLYGGLTALAQQDGRRVTALYSLSQMGLAAVGLFSFSQTAMTGAILLMISQGLCAASLFCFIGMLEYRGHTVDLSAASGLIKAMPAGAIVFLVMIMASFGFPGLSGFTSQVLIFLGAFESPLLGPPFVTFAALGTVLSAAYLLRMFHQTMFGDAAGSSRPGLNDLTARELIVLISIMVCSAGIGMVPKIVTARVEPAVQSLLARVEQKKEKGANHRLSESTGEEIEVLQMIEDQLKKGRAE